MNIEIREESAVSLPQYAQVPIAFCVESHFRVESVEGGLGGLRFVEEKVEPFYTKDYDSYDEGPTRWPKLWDISNWGILAAFCGDRRVGGAAVAYDTEGVDMLEGRKDMAVLWDMRVHPDFRRKGVGSELFQAALDWACVRECRSFKIETQNIYVPACRFYARQGARLRAITQEAYTECPGEAELIWQMALA